LNERKKIRQQTTQGKGVKSVSGARPAMGVEKMQNEERVEVKLKSERRTKETGRSRGKIKRGGNYNATPGEGRMMNNVVWGGGRGKGSRGGKSTVGFLGKLSRGRAENIY